MPSKLNFYSPQSFTEVDIKIKKCNFIVDILILAI